MNAGEGAAGKEAAAATATLGESLCCGEFDESPPEAFFDGEAMLLAGAWAPGVPAGAFPGWRGAGLLFIGTATLLSAVDIVCWFAPCWFAAAGMAGTLLEFL